jgi:membrane-associated phospholipid phosphatase
MVWSTVARRGARLTGPRALRAVAAYGMLLFLSGLALTVVVRNNELLWGEIPITRALSAALVRPIELALLPIDVLLTDVSSIVIYVILCGIVFWRWGLAPLAVLGLAGLLTVPTGLVDLAARPRPTPDVTWGQTIFGEGGYPSGHVVYSVLVFGTLALIIQRYEPPSQIRRLAVAILWTLTVLMGPIRIAQLKHWPADVVASYLFGLAFLAVVILLMPVLDKSRESDIRP